MLVHIVETSKEIISAPLQMAANTVKVMGSTALELADSSRTAQRLASDYQTERVEGGLVDLEVTGYLEDPDAEKMQVCHIIRIIVANIARARRDIEVTEGQRIKLIQDLFHAHLDGTSTTELPFSEEEANLLDELLSRRTT